MIKIKVLLNVLTLCVCLMSCESTTKPSSENTTQQEEKPEQSIAENTTTNNTKSACDYLPENEVRSVFNLDITAQLDIDEDANDSYRQCLYYFDNGYMYIIRHLTIPPLFKDDNKAFLEHIFKQYKGTGNQARPTFEPLDDLVFLAGWTPGNAKVIGNTIDFVKNNKRYTIHVKFIPNDNDKSRTKAIELAKIINN